MTSRRFQVVIEAWQGGKEYVKLARVRLAKRKTTIRSCGHTRECCTVGLGSSAEPFHRSRARRRRELDRQSAAGGAFALEQDQPTAVISCWRRSRRRCLRWLEHLGSEFFYE